MSCRVISYHIVANYIILYYIILQFSRSGVCYRSFEKAVRSHLQGSCSQSSLGLLDPWRRVCAETSVAYYQSTRRKIRKSEDHIPRAAEAWNQTEMDLKERGWEGLCWIYQAQNCEKRRTVMSTVMNLSGFIKRGEFLAWLSKWRLLKGESVRWSLTPVQLVVRSHRTIYHTPQSGSDTTLILRGPGFNSQPGQLILWITSFVVFLCLSRRMSG